MKQNIIHIGLDVDDTQYHGAAEQSRGPPAHQTSLSASSG